MYKVGNIYFESIKEKNKVVDLKIRENYMKTQYKIMNNKHGVIAAAHYHIAILERTLEIINEIKPKYYVIENPFGFMRVYLKRYKEIIQNYCTYCLYGFQYKKPTNLFSNIKLDLKSCNRGDNCHKNNFYTRGKKNKISNRSICKTYLERSAIPTELLKSIIIKIENINNESEELPNGNR